jgi:hypothetical protein
MQGWMTAGRGKGRNGVWKNMSWLEAMNRNGISEGTHLWEEEVGVCLTTF